MLICVVYLLFCAGVVFSVTMISSVDVFVGVHVVCCF